jgi:SAM-dependent methyltransferase
VRLWPRPSDGEILQSYDSYLPLAPGKVQAWETMMAPVIRVSRDLVEARASTGGRRLLDIGCGHGFFLREMASRGWAVEGIEVSAAGRAYAAERLGFEVHAGPLEAAGLPAESFDVVTLFYVIEHVTDPIGCLNEVRRILRPGGLMLLRWPHSTPIIRLLGPLARWLDLYHTPYHLYDFSPKTIRRLLHLTGFEGIETLIGGHTRPEGMGGRASAWAFGALGEGLLSLSRGKVLLPGVSKTTLAYTARERKGIAR